MIRNAFYEQFDEAYSSINGFLSNYCKSTTFQNFFQNKIESLFYGNLVNIFFVRLNRKNVKELKLPKGKLGQIRTKYRDIQKNVRLALSSHLKDKMIDEEFYNNFKMKIEKEFPEFLKIIIEIEKEIDTKRAKSYLKQKGEEIKKIGKPAEDFDALIKTIPMEVYVQEKKRFPIGQNFKRLIRNVIREELDTGSKEIFEDLKKDSRKMLDDNRKVREGFENRLYKRWKEPLRLLERLIQVSLEAGEKHRKKLAKIADKTSKFKREAIIKLHARALQISNEILVLLKSGFADGANARWRLLHELTVISHFLVDSNDVVSQRFLEHEVTEAFREATDYKKYYKKLGFSPINRKTFNKLKKEKDDLCKKYGAEFKKDYGWIPDSIIKGANFKKLEEHVNLDKLRPFYNLSTDATHAKPKGFHGLGLMKIYQKKILLVGASNYGLAAPIQITASSLFGISICLLNLESDFESIFQMKIMKNFIGEISTRAFEIQKELEKEELDRIS